MEALEIVCLFLSILVTICIFSIAALADVYASGELFTKPTSSVLDGSVTDETGRRFKSFVNDTVVAVTVPVGMPGTMDELGRVSASNFDLGGRFGEWMIGPRSHSGGSRSRIKASTTLPFVPPDSLSLVTGSEMPIVVAHWGGLI